MPDLAAYQARLDAVLASVDRLTTDEIRFALGTLVDVRRALLERISVAAGSESTYTSVVLTSLLAEVNRLGAEYEARLRRHMTAALRSAWAQGQRANPDAYAAAGLDYTFGLGLDSRLLDIASQITADMVTKVSQAFITDASTAIRLGSLGGASVSQTMARVRALLATEPARQTGTIGPIAAQAERIVRTEIMRVYSLANQARTLQADALVPGLRKYWQASFDVRTRPEHLAAWERYRPGGRTGPIPVDQDFIVGGERAKYPYDPRLSAEMSINCRCRSINWHPDWAEEAA